MTGGSIFRKAKKIISRVASNSRTETDRSPETLSAPTLEEFQAKNEYSGTQQAGRHSIHSYSPQTEQQTEGVWMIDEAGTPVKRRGRTTCADLQNMPAGMRVHIEVNDQCIPCGVSESILLGSYLGVVARDPMLVPINFSDWRNKGLEPFKKKMLTEVEGKFSFPSHINTWILQSLGVKWRNYKMSLKAEYFDSRPLSEIMEDVPDGVDASQWCQLVIQWSQPADKERAKKNTENAKKQTCPHTMGRVSSVRRQTELETQDRLLLWRANRLHKDGSWSSEDAQQRWAQACEILSVEGLTPDDLNVEANERVFSIVMGAEHGGRVKVAGFGVTPTKYFSQSTRTPGQSSKSSDIGTVHNLKQKFKSFKEKSQVFQEKSEAFQEEMRAFMEEFRRTKSKGQRSQMDDESD